MLNDAVESGRNAAASRQGAVLLFGGLGLISGLLSTQMMDALSTEEWRSPLVGAVFGLALCLGFYLMARPKWLHLAAVFLAVQLSWQVALETAIRVEGGTRPAPSVDFAKLFAESIQQGLATVQPSGQGDSAPLQSETKSWLRVNTNMILPGLAGGAVGALGTWLGAAFCVAALRRPRAAIAVVLTGMLAGLALVLDSMALFPIWQTAVAASLALMAMPPSGESGPST